MTQPDDDDRTARYDTSHATPSTGGGDTSSYESPYRRPADAPGPYSSSTAAPYGGGDDTTRSDQQWSFDDTYGRDARDSDDRPVVPVARQDDKLWPHLAWELLLVGGVVLGVILVLIAGPAEALVGAGRNTLLAQFAIVGFVATAFALSLRAATPNFAVGGAGGLAGVLVAWLTTEQDWALPLAAVVAVVAAAALGLGLAVLVVGLHVPSWAATLGVGALLPLLALGLVDGAAIALRGNDYRMPWLWAIAVAVISIGGGLLCATRGFRSFFGSPRRLDDEPVDPAVRPGGRSAAAATLALVGSTALAAVGGIVLVLSQRAAMPGGGDLTVVAVAVALLGGVSAFGRRGGIAGVVLATAVFVLVRHAMLLAGMESWLTQSVPAAGALILGLVATRFIESANRRRTH